MKYQVARFLEVFTLLCFVSGAAHARTYDPSTGRFMQLDPSGFDSGETNLYSAMKNNPLRYVDPDGMSAQDVNRIRNAFNNYVQYLNSIGMRYSGSPSWNNMMRFLNDRNSNWGAPYLSCNEQAYATQQKLSTGKYDDQWSFIPEGSNWPHYQPQDTIPIELGPHHWVRAISSNPTDPSIIIDPWQNVFAPQGKK